MKFLKTILDKIEDSRFGSLALLVWCCRKYGILKGTYRAIPRPHWFYTIKSWFFPGNVIKIKTLGRRWNESDDLLVHGMFQVLVDFVEKQLLGNDKTANDIFFNLEDEKRRLIEEGFDEEMVKIQLDQLELENNRNIEILALYEWWTKKYPIRDNNDPLHSVKPPEYAFIPVSSDPKAGSKLEFIYDNEEHQKLHDEATKKYYEWEDNCTNEDTDMLIRLIKIRACLWT